MIQLFSRPTEAVVRCSVPLLFLVAGLFASVVFPVSLAADAAGNTSVPAPTLRYARSAAVLDVASDTVLYELRGDETWPPASLTKLVTIYTALEASERGEFELSAPQPVHPNAFVSAVPPGSSLMFLGPDQMVNGEDLLRGLAISSGNDAAVEVAMRVSGSVSSFAGAMNGAVRRLGYDQFFFEEPSGLSPANRVTAVGFARFSAVLLARWPWLTDRLFSLPEFTYPLDRHYVNGLQGGSIRQMNRNGLIGSYDGADGLKTGFIDESGYNLAATAVRGDRRLIAVVLGVQADSHREGGLRREEDTSTLLDWAFDSFEVVELARPEASVVDIWGGDRRTVTASASAVLPVSVPRGSGDRIVGRVDQRSGLWAPVASGTTVGTVRYSLDDRVLREVPLVVREDVDEGGVLRRMFDRIRWWFAGILGNRDAEPAPASPAHG